MVYRNCLVACSDSLIVAGNAVGSPPMNGYRLSPRKPSWLRRRLSLFITCTLTALVLAAGGNSAYAQTDPKIQRSFINLSFEENDPVLDGCTSISTSRFVSDEYVAGWTTTHSEGSISCGPRGGRPIELWSREFQDVAAHDGNIHAELNAHEEAVLYQTVCLMEGDIVSFSFAHRSRFAGAGDTPMPDTDRMAFQLANESDDPHEWSGETNVIEVSSANDGSAGTVHTCIGSCAAPAVEGRWNVYSGQFNWTGATGLKRFGFRAIASASGNNSVGNFLDSISLAGIVPVIELDTTEAEGFEGEHNSTNFPANIVVSGNIPAGETLEVTLSIVHQETDAADVSPNDKIRIEIPSGNYAGEKFPIPLEIVKDDLAEDLETFRLEVDDQPGIYRAGSTSTCGAPGVLAMTYTIKDAHASIEKQGTFVDLVGGTGPDGLPIKNAGDRMDYVFTVTNSGGIDLDNIVVSDTIIGTPQLDPAQSDIGPDGRLKAGGKAVYLASYTLTQADIDRGVIANIATVTASLPDYPDQPPVTDTSEHSELLPHIPAISMVKTGAFDPETDDGDGLPDPGERLRFDITVTNGGNISAFNVQPDDPGPTFDGQPATGMMTPFTPGPVTLLPGEVQVFTAYYTLSAEDIAMGSGITDAVANQASVSARDPAGGLLEGLMPGPMKLTMPGFGVEKRAEITQAQRGGRVPYTLFLKPLGLVQTSRVRLADLMPPGFVYMPGTATVDGTPVEPLVAGRRLSWKSMSILRMMLS